VTDLDAIRSRHRVIWRNVVVTDGIGAAKVEETCHRDGQTWPCDTAQAFVHLDELEAALHPVIAQLAQRYDDQWAVGSVYLVDLDRLRDVLAGQESVK
jgi:hypothetical protein